jgi:hypothetical protein
MTSSGIVNQFRTALMCVKATAERNELGILGHNNLTLKAATYQQLGFFPM